MSSGTDDVTPPTPSAAGPTGGSFLDQVGPHAVKILLGACAVGLISVFLPCVTVTVLDHSASVSAVQNWRGILCLVAYVGVGVMSGMALKSEMNRKQVLASLIATGVAALLALWLLASVSGSGLGAVSTGIGTYLNILASLVAAGAAALLAKQAKIF